LPNGSPRPPVAQVERIPELLALIESSSWLVAVLGSVYQAGLPNAWICAGVIRDLVWDTKFGNGFDPSRISDVDVAFFDPVDLRTERDRAAELRLLALRPDVRWDAKNQAAVHTSYPNRFGIAVEPFRSMAEAAASWPETATAVAIRRSNRTSLEVIAPYGLDDLLDGVWRLQACLSGGRRRLC